MSADPMLDPDSGRFSPVDYFLALARLVDEQRADDDPDSK